jgi:hypothetical protein
MYFNPFSPQIFQFISIKYQANWSRPGKVKLFSVRYFIVKKTMLKKKNGCLRHFEKKKKFKNFKNVFLIGFKLLNSKKQFFLKISQLVFQINVGKIWFKKKLAKDDALQDECLCEMTHKSWQKMTPSKITLKELV